MKFVETNWQNKVNKKIEKKSTREQRQSVLYKEMGRTKLYFQCRDKARGEEGNVNVKAES